MEHPITPPQELVQQWRKQAPVARDAGATREQWIATQAARWGADQELEACLSRHRRMHGDYAAERLLADRRPKPPSLKEQALAVLDDCSAWLDAANENTIRRALEALSDD